MADSHEAVEKFLCDNPNEAHKLIQDILSNGGCPHTSVEPVKCTGCIYKPICTWDESDKETSNGIDFQIESDLDKFLIKYSFSNKPKLYNVDNIIFGNIIQPIVTEKLQQLSTQLKLTVKEIIIDWVDENKYHIAFYINEEVTWDLVSNFREVLEKQKTKIIVGVY